MKQFTMIQFNRPPIATYYQSKNNIIRALNAGEFCLRSDVKKATYEDADNELRIWTNNGFTFIAKVSQDLRKIEPGTLIGIETIYMSYSIGDIRKSTTFATVEFNFIPPITISPTMDAIIRKEEYTSLLNSIGLFPPVITQEVTSYISGESYPLKEGEDPYIEDKIVIQSIF